MDVAYGIDNALFYQLHIGKVSSVSRPIGWYMKGLPWNSILGNDFNSFVLENRNFVEIRFVGMGIA